MARSRFSLGGLIAGRRQQFARLVVAERRRLAIGYQE
jgi:hypothetical protein